jgi:hypothetical protein
MGPLVQGVGMPKRNKYMNHMDRMRMLYVEGKTHRELTNERQSERDLKYVRANGSRVVTLRADAETAAALIYLRREWGFESATETVDAAIRFTMVATKLGLQRLDTRVYEALVRLEQDQKELD